MRTRAQRMAEICPSILAADFTRLGEQVGQAARGGARTLHVDVMDGHFVPNLSIGIPVVESLSRMAGFQQDCHLMVERPERYLTQFVGAGAAGVTVHQEACPDLAGSVRRIRELGASAGVAVNPATPLSTLEEVLPIVDLVLVMSVHPGFGGQDFLPASLDRIRELASIRARRSLGFRIQVDGGVNLANARPLGEAGCDQLVAGSSVFGSPDIAGAVRDLAERANARSFAPT